MRADRSPPGSSGRSRRTACRQRSRPGSCRRRRRPGLRSGRWGIGCRWRCQLQAGGIQVCISPTPVRLPHRSLCVVIRPHQFPPPSPSPDIRPLASHLPFTAACIAPGIGHVGVTLFPTLTGACVVPGGAGHAGGAARHGLTVTDRTLHAGGRLKGQGVQGSVFKC